VSAAAGVPDGEMGLDIGPASIEAFSKVEILLCVVIHAVDHLL
jgi:hypothetical protein